MALRLSTTADSDTAAPLPSLPIPRRLWGVLCRVPLRLLLLLSLGAVHPAWDIYQTLQLAEAWEHSPP